MKKILILLTILLSFWTISVSAMEVDNIKEDFDFYLDANKIVWNFDENLDETEISTTDFSIEWWFKTTIYNWVKNISTILFLISIFAIVYGWLMMTLSAWEDEKIKKAKDIIKWSMLWFLALISAWAIITIVINLIFWL